MNYNKTFNRNWQFNCAESGMHPNWAFDNARDFAAIALKKGIEPWRIFPGTRQVQIETYEEVTPYQLSIFAQKVEKSKLGAIVDKIWMSGSYLIYIDYIGRVDDEKASKIADFKIGDRLQDLVSGEEAEVVEVTDNAFGLKFKFGGIVHRYEKRIVKCGYKLIKSK